MSLGCTKSLLFFICLLSGINIYAQKKQFKLSAGAYRGTIQWEQSSDRKIWSEITDGQIDSLAVEPVKTSFYRAKISEPGCNPVFSDIKGVYVDGSFSVGMKIVKGRVILPQGSTPNFSELKILSLLEEVKPDTQGFFEIAILDSSIKDIVTVLNKNDEVIMLNYIVGNVDNYDISAETTAMSVLLMYPFLKPVPDEEKQKFKDFYKTQPEFPNLTLSIEKLIVTGSALFSENNAEVINSASLLINTSINNARFRRGSGEISAKITGNPFNIYSSGQSSVTLSNLSSFNYTARIYNTKFDPVTPPITIEGSSIAEFSATKYLYQFYQYLLGDNEEISDEAKLDFKNEYKLPPGQYQIKVTNGFLNDGSEEDKTAFYKNLYGVFSVSVASILDLSDLFLIKEECFKSFFDAEVAVTNVFNVKSAIENKSFLKDYLLPVLIQFREFSTKCNSIDPASPNYPKWLKIFDKLLGVYSIVEKGFPIAYYTYDWLTGPISFTGCQFMDDNFKTQNCFKIQSVNTITPKTYTCDTVELKIKVIEDDIYYSHTNSPVTFLDFNWLSTGQGIFLSSGTGNAAGKTNLDGEASVFWKMPPGGTEGEQIAVAAKLVGNNTFITQTEFKTNSFDPKLNIVAAKGHSQKGRVDSFLPEPIVIGVVDQTPGEFPPMYINRFETKIEITGGGSIETDADNSSVIQKGWKWKLGPEEGEQTVKITVTSKNCDWQIENNPIIFTATATSLPVLTSSSATSITRTTAVSGGNITSDGGSPIIARGVCWGSLQNPTIVNNPNKTSDGTGTGSFTSSITGLKADSTYHVRVYAITSTDTVYGNDISFTTLAVALPALTTNNPGSITFNSAVSGGTITDDGGDSVTVRGICWGTSPNPTISDNTINAGEGSGSFISSITGLKPNTKYYVRAFASNNKGIGYGNEISFTTLQVNIPALATSTISSITQTSAVAGGNITNNGGADITAKGVCWSTSPNPTVALPTKTNDGTGNGSFVSNITGLTVNTTYYVRAYATNSAGTAYGNEVSFKTSANNNDTTEYLARYWVPRTIVNNYITLRLYIENDIVTGRGLIASYPLWGIVTGTINGTNMILNFNYDNGVTPECIFIPQEPPGCPSCQLKVFPGGTYGIKENWIISGTVNSDHTSFNATYIRKTIVTQIVGESDCSFHLLIQGDKGELTENGNFTY